MDNLEKWKIIKQKVFETRIADSFEFFRQNDIEPILIKGWAAALNYPNTFDRTFTDIDLAFSKNDYEKARKFTDKNKYFIDLHDELRHLDSLDWNKLFANSRLIKINDTPVRILSSEDHLRVLCIHWLNDGGAYKERLWDIYYAVANRPDNFNWDKCLSSVSDKRQKWVICAVKIAEKYLGLELKNMPNALVEYEIPSWVLKTIEKEWGNHVKLKPLLASTNNWKDFAEQIKIRIPPNSIQATIETDGEFDNNSRKLIQTKNFFNRLKKALKSES